MSHETGQDRTTGPLGCRVDRYAVEHGMQVGTVRKRIQRGQLAGYKGDDHRWYVLDGEPPDATPDATQDKTGHATRQDTRQDATGAVAVNANARAQLEAIRDEWLQPLVATISQQAERIGRLEAEQESISARLAAKDEIIGAKDELIADLRAEFHRRAERDRAGVAQTVADALRAQEPPEEAPAGMWGRLRRWWRG